MDAATHLAASDGAELFDDFFIGGLAGFHKLVTHGVGIEYREAEVA